MSKKLNEDTMASELAGSAFFQPPASSRGIVDRESTGTPDEELHLRLPSPSAGTYARRPDRTSETPPLPPRVRTPVRRVITRYAFEFYQDQVEQLRRMALEEKLLGQPGSMSEMVRDALDAFLNRKEEPAA